MSTLVIGLGGTGIKTIVHVKKMLMDSNRDGVIPGDVKLLGLDTRQDPEVLQNVGPWVGTYAIQHKEELDNVQIHRTNEYFWLGGSLGDNCGKQEDEYIARWFDSSYFCNLPTKNTVMTVVDGAGMYRQIGRRGLFHWLQSGTTSHLYQQIHDKVSSFPEATFTVIICGSIAGGTGASLFIDIAHLTQVIAKNCAKVADITAMIVLPKAFSSEPHVNVDNAMQARGLSAMRELTRFIKIHDAELGFFMQYTPTAQDHMINRRAQGSPFSLVYLLEERVGDPQNPTIHNPLDVPIADGIAPTLATWVSRLCDHTLAAEYNAWKANITALRNNYQFSGLTGAFSSTFGTYSIVLPLAAIVENWTMKLAGEALQSLAPKRADGSLDDAKFGGEASKSGAEQAKDDRRNHPVRIMRDASDCASKWSPDARTTLIKRAQERTVQGFRVAYLDDTSTDEEIRMFENMEKTWFYNNAARFPINPFSGALCKEITQRNMPVEARANTLHSDCESAYKNAAGKWEIHLRAIKERQLARFRAYTLQLAQDTLNGTGDITLTNVSSARSGKLGWLLSYIDQQIADLVMALDIYEAALKNGGEKIKGLQTEWQVGPDGQVGILQAMQKDAGRQKDYLRRRQDWLKIKRWEMLLSIEVSAIKEMSIYLTRLKEQLDEYRVELVGAQNSVQARIGDENSGEIGKISTKRTEAEKAMVKVREVVNDPDWELEQYNHFRVPDPSKPAVLANVLMNLTWQVKPITVEGVNQPGVQLIASGFAPVTGTDLESTVITNRGGSPERRAQGNLLRLLEVCRQHFMPAWNELTVVDYYEWRAKNKQMTSDEFGSKLLQKCNVLLAPGPNNCEVPKRNVYLLVPEGTEGRPFLQKAIEYLRMNTPAVDRKQSRNLPHSDRTTLTYIVLADGIEIEKISAFKNSVPFYLHLPPSSIGAENSRGIIHIFQAEKRATQFDEIKPQEDYYLVSPRVSMVLENENLLYDFMLGLAMGYIQRDDVTLPNGNLGHMIVARVPVKVEELGRFITTEVEYRLNDPSNVLYSSFEVEYLVAAETYCLRELDYSLTERKPLEDLRMTLHNLIECQIEERMGQYLPGWISGSKGFADAIDAANLQEGDARKRRLILETRKELYRELNTLLVQRETEINDLPLADRNKNKQLPDELEFLTILKKQIQQMTRTKPQTVKKSTN